ncbi:TATA box-binding protein-associated factor RNA polymerase I subunit D [Pelobates fuscus]|uniref:TATA box-binding protein-associated factor RNA polymerase I subunit D n=1 Tax=Pelobates fuscus TaxID=191477 RepID=UPI002FE4A5DC
MEYNKTHGAVTDISVPNVAQLNHLSQQENTAEGVDQDIPPSPELFSDSENSTNKDDCSTVESDDSGSLFQTEVTCMPTRRGGKKPAPRLSYISSDDSSDYVPPTKKLTLHEIFQKHFGKRKRKIGKAGKYRPQPRKTPKNKKAYRKRMLHKGIKFPFKHRKHLSFRMSFAYEQFVLGGFLHHVEKLKSERSLHNSLKSMNVTEDLDDDSFAFRKYKYLDDEGPISPISEPDENANCDQEEPEEDDARIVDNNCFILSCTGTWTSTIDLDDVCF